jgi:uncharacterized protein (DUF302 family)
MKVIIRGLCVALAFCSIQLAQAGQEYTVKQSRYSVGESMDRLENILKQKGIIIFSRIYHSVGAKKAGIPMRPTQLLIFGNPKVGSPLINENPLVALDLPLKVLAWQDENNQTWLAYLNPAELQKRHNIRNSEFIAKMTNALNKVTNKALGYK